MFKFSFGITVLVILLDQSFGQDSAATLCQAAQSDCGSCINAHADCTWCTDDVIDGKRCRAISETRNCSSLENPRNEMQFISDTDFSVYNESFFNEINDDKIKQVVQVRPQKLKIKLRKDVPLKFNVTFKKVIDYPLDLYYLMDLSNSMKDDLFNLRELSVRLVNEIKSSVTFNAKFGYGTFVDKVTMPFASTVPEKQKNPCQAPEVCAPSFSFRHHLNLSFTEDEGGNGNVFSRAVGNTNISGNIDAPEGGFDALMQVAVCKNSIGWRDGATHMVLYATDASPHTANDGRLAGILIPNDMQCHMQKAKYVNSNLDPDDLVYSNSKKTDYPSIGQLKSVFLQNKVKVIFAVTENVIDMYKDMPEILSTNVFVDVLNSDSSNIVELIRSAYEVLKSKLQLNIPQPPPGVQLKFRYLCPNESDWKNNTETIECSNIKNNDSAIYEFELTSSGCPSDPNRVDKMGITSGSLQDEVEVEIEYICDCGCRSGANSNSTECNGSGTAVCGICECNSGKAGSTCQCESEVNGKGVFSTCKRPKSNSYCEGNGECDCGKCKCNKDYKGTYCECYSKGCATAQNDVLCGNGVCNNCDGVPDCVCNEGWEKNSLGVCTCSNQLCVTSQTSTNTTFCNGHGTCACDRCECESTHRGGMCEECIHPSCIDIEATCTGTEVVKCVQCLARKDKSGESEGDCLREECHAELWPKLVREFYPCGSCDSLASATDESACLQDCDKHLITDAFGNIKCAMKTEDECTTNFEIYWLNSYRYTIYVKRFVRDTDCPQPVDTILIVGPVVGGIVFLGIIALIAWKIWQTLRDKREYERFQKDVKNKRWTAGQNPIYEKAEKKFNNPMFAGDISAEGTAE